MGYGWNKNDLRISPSDFISFMRAYIPRVENYNTEFPSDAIVTVILCEDDNQIENKTTKKFLDTHYPDFDIITVPDQEHSPKLEVMLKYFD